MQWICLPQRIRVPEIFDDVVVWYSLYDARFALVGNRGVILVDCDHLFPVVTIKGDSLGLESGLYDGRPWFSGAGAFFWSIVRDCWVYNPRGLYEPRSFIDPDTGEDEGDEWYEGEWSFDAFATQHATATLEPHGSAQDAVTVSVDWPHWVKQGASIGDLVSCLGGKYLSVCNAGGNIDLGVAGWRRSTDDRVFIRRSGAGIVSVVGSVRIVPAASLVDGDKTGDLVFSDAPGLRLRNDPVDGASAVIYILRDNGLYDEIGSLESLGENVVPYLSSAPSNTRDIYAATVPQWI